MRKIIHLAVMVIVLGCTSHSRPVPPVTSTTQIEEAIPVSQEPTWNVYHPDPEHIWNRVYRQLYERSADDATAYGLGELDPLLWFDTTYLLIGAAHQQTIKTLDGFLTTHAESLIEDPLKRAMFQRDVWAVFDWLASNAELHPAQRTALQRRLVPIIRRVALAREQIASLPDNYALAVQSNAFPPAFQEDDPQRAFLPADFFQPYSAWVPMGREGGPIAMTHTEAFPFFGRSVFLILVRSPGGRVATLEFIESLNTRSNPVTATGTEVALVRRMVLIDDEGNPTLSPLVESIQVRHFSPRQRFYEFELNREHLFSGLAGGLEPKTAVIPLFMSHGDVFEHPMPGLPLAVPDLCAGCHFEHSPSPNSGSTRSIISYSREPFALADHERPVLFAANPMDEAEKVVDWKLNHQSWQTLKTFWNQ